MELVSIPVHDFVTRIHNLWDRKWFLVTSGDFKKRHFNTMTVSWGYLGIMWNKPVAVVVVRPTRFTFGFIEQYDTFTLSAFDKKYRKDLNLLGSKSGRDGDKIAETQLTVVSSEVVAAPTFSEAELIIECRKIYWDDIKPEHILDPKIERNYPLKDYHRMYIGEIQLIKGLESYRVSL